MGPFRISAVSFLNTRPLIYGLAERAIVRRDVPAKLLEHLESDQADVALLSAIDLQRSSVPLTILPAGCIASSGETLTVRVFSRVKAEQIRQLHADTDSHTARALAQVLWAERFGCDLRMLDYRLGQSLPCDAQAVLLIGDKVVTSPPPLPYQYDLGLLWSQWTHLPFTFAVWAARRQAASQELCDLLSQCLYQGRQHMDEIVQLAQREHHWPAELARTYLTQNLEFTFTPRHRDGMERFFGLCHEHRLLEAVRPLDVLNLELRSADFELKGRGGEVLTPMPGNALRNSKLEIRNSS